MRLIALLVMLSLCSIVQGSPPPSRVRYGDPAIAQRVANRRTATEQRAAANAQAVKAAMNRTPPRSSVNFGVVNGDAQRQRGEDIRLRNVLRSVK